LGAHTLILQQPVTVKSNGYLSKPSRVRADNLILRTANDGDDLLQSAFPNQLQQAVCVQSS
jgi:hypothetical protein